MMDSRRRTTEQTHAESSSAEHPKVIVLTTNAAGTPATHSTAVPSRGPRNVERPGTAPSARPLGGVASPTTNGMPALSAGRYGDVAST